VFTSHTHTRQQKYALCITETYDNRSQDSILSKFWAGMRDIMVRFPAGGIDFFLLQNVHVESLAHPPSYSMDTGVSFPRVYTLVKV